MTDTVTATPDSEHRGFVAWLPATLRPFALLARFDRPIGWQLLYWPCVFHYYRYKLFLLQDSLTLVLFLCYF